MIKTIEQLMEVLERGGAIYGVRGISGKQGKEDYTQGQLMEFSIDNWDGRDNDYHEDMPLLNGTCAFAVDGNTMWEDDILKMVEKALVYSDCGKVALIKGDTIEEGTDELEVIISNSYDPAEFVDYISLEILGKYNG